MFVVALKIHCCNMATHLDGKAMKNHAKSKDPTQQTLTINFAPEKQRYSKPTNMEEHIRTYFEGMNGINRRIIAEERKIIAQNRNTWPDLTVEERDELLNDRFIATSIRQKYNTNDKYWKEKTPWQPEELISSEELKPRPRVERTDSMSLNDSFSKPFQWATKSQRNLKFPAIKQEKRRNNTEQLQKAESTLKTTNEGNTTTNKVNKTTNKENKTTTGDETVRKLNNVEQSMKEKQIKTKNENIKGKVKSSELEKSTVEDKPKTSTSNENLNPPDKQESTSEQDKTDGNEYMDGSDNIFEFLQSWNP